MKIITMKQAFGKETKWTESLVNNKDWLYNLIEECRMLLSSEIIYEYNTELLTQDKKRVDIVVKDGDDVIITIESQDSTGWLDPLHASKSQYYAFEFKSKHNIILCEESNEHIKDYIRYENLHPDKNNYLVQCKFVRMNEEILPIFTCIIRPESVDKKKQYLISSKNKVEKEEIEINNRAIMQLEFWELLLNKIKEKGIKEHSRRKPTNNYILGHGAGKTGFLYAYSRLKEGLGVELELHIKNKELKNLYFDQIMTHKKEILKYFPEMKFIDSRETSISRIRYIIKGDVNNKEEWEYLQEKGIEEMQKLYKFFEPIVKKLK